MRRRDWISSALATCLAPALDAQTDFTAHGELVVEKAATGKPHASKVLAAIQPHCDDIPIFAGGTVAKLLNEGYTGHLIRVTNDDSAGEGSVGTVVLNNEKDNDAVGRALGLKSVFNLNYPNHNMDGTSRPELRGRLIFLFRLLKVDTVICYDPWGHYEENPDHYVTASCVEAACWMAGGAFDYPEHFAAGLKPHAVSEKYYFARFEQKVNRVVDISSTVEKKIDANVVNVTQGPAGTNGSRLRKALAETGRTLPLLGNDDRTADREYIRQFVLARDAATGAKYGLKYAEQFHYIGPGTNEVEDYVKRNALRK